MDANDKKECDRAIEKRKRLIESLTRVVIFTEAIKDETTIELIAVRLEALNDLMVEFRIIEDKIMSYPDQISEIIDVEMVFFETKAILQHQINARNNVEIANTDPRLNQTIAQIALNQTNFLETFKATSSKAADVRLPKINIQPFGGKYEEFPAFKDLFESSIHENDSISKALKFQFLKGVLRDDAALLIRHIKCTATNYEEAWKKIVERYDKKKPIVTKYIQMFLDISPVTRSNQLQLRALHNTADEVIRGLRALGTDAEGRDPWVINILLSKLDLDTRRMWSQKTLHNDFPTLESFLKFIGEHCDTIENSELTSSITRSAVHPTKKIGVHHTTNVPSTTLNNRIIKCEYCQSDHPLYKCSKFKSMNISDRRDFVLKHNICFNCLIVGHSSKFCRSKYSCHYCKGKHHSSLHLSSTAGSSADSEQPLASTTTTLTNCLQEHNQPSNQMNKEHNQSSISQTHNQNRLSTALEPRTAPGNQESIQGNYQVHIAHTTATEHLLPTAVVNIENVYGKVQQCRILLDSGSMGNLISQSLVKQLQLPQKKSNTIVSGIASNTTSRWKSTVKLSSCFDPHQHLTIDVHILASLSSVPNQTFIKPHIHQFEQLDLADPNFNIRNPVDFILSAGTVFSMLLPGSLRDPYSSVIAQKTIFGWVLVGDVAATSTFISSKSLYSMHSSCIDIDKTLQLFWKSEEVSTSSQFTHLEKQCEQFYKQTIKRDCTGRYVARLPFNDIQQKLGNSLRSAVSRLLAIEKKLDKNNQLKVEYHSFIAEYIALNHMEKISNDQININSEHFYLPHHFVMKTDSSTTKLRVVFDGSCSTSSGVSLNQKLLVGPTVQEHLTVIIMRFRMHNIVFCPDVEKMYRQVLIDATDRDYQRIVWRFDPKAEIDHYRLTTVTYGTAAAPFLATRTLKQLSEDNKVTYPLASKIISRDCYVDDLLTGASTVEEALKLQHDIVKLLDSAGFTLRKWSSNSSAFMAGLSQLDTKQSIPLFKVEDHMIKVLGLHWQPETDHFTYKVQSYSSNTVLTKRIFLSQASKLFDPFGWLSPVVVTTKILFQELWLLNLAWDDPLPRKFTEKWENIKLNLKCLEQIKIHRQMLFNHHHIQLHGFCDASEAASAAVIYCRSYDSNGYPRVQLVTAKTKVAPVHSISIPRLELNGALLLARIFSQVQQAFKDYEVEVYAWSDSEIVLAWLSSHPKRWKTYVANRTSEILDTLPRKHWRHVGSNDNPADLASRGIQPADLVENEFWFSGPTWLIKNESDWPSTQIGLQQSTELEKKKLVLQTNISINDSIDNLFNRISSWAQLKRIVAFCKRFIHNCRNPTSRRKGIVTATELRTAENDCILSAQETSFTSEIKELRKHNYLRSKSTLSKLSPFLDSEGILRVGGRLQHSSVNYNTKHPIILHHTHVLSKIIVSYQHKLFLHPSPSLLSSLLRNNYWIVGGSFLTKRESHNCIKCVRYRAQTSKQMMGTLPQARVIQSRPFTHTGIDFAGPVMLQSKRGRGAKPLKSYICVFVCLSVKAIHLEVASDLSSDAFIAAFKRFVSRRGLPSDVYTDNGTNFVGAHRKFSTIFSTAELISNYESIRLFCAEKTINWHFSPPSAPHFGGVWEAAVKSMKTHLRIITGRAKFTFEEMCTFVTEIECILNSRPLCPQFKDDINSLEAITPGHFLIMGPLTSIPEAEFADIPMNKLTRWQHVQQATNIFWRKYHKEYLNTLQQRNKWRSATKNLEVGDVVIVKDNLPAAYWGLARIINVHPGTDGLVRVVTLKSKNAILKRPVHNLVKLPAE